MAARRLTLALLALELSSGLGATSARAQPPIDVTWTELVPEHTRAADGFFGGNTAFDGTTLLVGGDGRIDVFHWDGEAMVFDQQLDPGPEDHPGFGWEGFDVYGDRIIVTDARAESERGAVSFYQRGTDGVWDRVRRDVGPCCDNGVFALGIEFEGDHIVGGAPYFGGGFGTALLLRADASGDFAYTPTRYSRFTPTIGNLAGFGIAMSGDLVALGSLGGFTAPADSGGVFVLRDTGSSLVEVRRIDNPTPSTQDQFGIDVQMDARVIAVGARYDDGSTQDTGAVHVFDHEGRLLQTLSGPETFARLGAALDLDGDWLIGGAPAFIPPGVTTESAHLGSILLYQRGADGLFHDRGRFPQIGGTLGTHFGIRTEIVGNVIVVGANAARVGATANAGRVWIGVLSEPIGEACPSDVWCASGHCVDGVCCQSVCDGTCEACAMAITGQSDGTCAPVIDGTDPDAECADGCAPSACASGACTVPMCDGGTSDDAGASDGGRLDGSVGDAGRFDAGPRDGGAAIDGANEDAGAIDAGPAVPRVPLSCTCRVSGGLGAPPLSALLAMGLLTGSAIARARRRRPIGPTRP